MIYLTTGGNGAGKTLFVLKDVRDQQVKEGRPVYFHGFKAKQILLDWGWKEFDPKLWQDLPDGSICVMDECQNEFPYKIQGELPDYINAVAQHRRRRGFDFWMITPHPSMIHVNVRRLIESPSWHRHMRRVFGSDMVSELRFNYAEMGCEKPDAGKRGVANLRSYPKEVYDWYESASLHTGKRKIPKQIYFLGVALVLIPTLLFFVYRHFATMGEKSAAVAAAKGGQQVAGGMAPPTAMQRYLTASEYLEVRKSRLDDFPHTAPVYDEVTKPVTAPYPAACVRDEKRCVCYSQQATQMQVSHDVCLQIVSKGYFVDWDDGRNKRDQGGQFGQQQQQQPSYRPQAAYQPAQMSVADTPGWAERNAARNAATVSTLKR